SFGMGGTDAYCIVSAAPEPAPRLPGPSAHLLVLSARTQTAWDRMALALADHLEAHPALDLRDVAYTLAVGRSAFSRRRSVVAHDLAEAVAALRQPRAASDATAPPPLHLFIPEAAAASACLAHELPAFGAALAAIHEDMGTDEPAFAVPCALAQMWMEWGAD